MESAPARSPGASDGRDPGPPLLGPGDPPPVRIVHPGGKASVLVVCDHAANAVPRALGTLGLDPARLAEHIGWDIGAAAVAERLAQRLDAPSISTGFSRLVIDCNRAFNDPSLIPEVSDNVPVPGNRGLRTAEREARIAAFHRPYHEAITECVAGFGRRGIVPAIVSIHSFTPRMNGEDRPWHVGVLWDRDPRMALPLIANLAQGGGIAVGDNQPYSARSPQGYTMAQHALAHGLPHVLIEIRQNEIADDAGAERYADLIERALRPILADPQLYRTAFYP
ncbi:MAG TPA: N-formylglutamate amidohydrolase [Stellaceae bacterium]|nr:N-formylglutamate amidohydrolase [Stellaceae bacterium]